MAIDQGHNKTQGYTNTHIVRDPLMVQSRVDLEDAGQKIQVRAYGYQKAE